MTMAKAEWKPHRLDELGFVGRGKSRHRPRNDSRLYGGSYPFIQTADVMAADPYITSYSQTYTEFGLQQSKLWPPNTLCMTIAGANTAKTAILKFEACFPDSVVGFIPDEKKSDLCFVKYSLDLMKERFLSITRGATQDNLSLDKLLSFSIPTPPLTVQRRIAGILSAYDDLIENNLRRIIILEEMARTLYQEWFVTFRFPGHEKGRMVDSPLGNIPEGWKVASFLEIPHFEFIGENIPPYDGTKTYYATADVNGIEITGEGIEYTYKEKPSRAQKQPELNSVWFARMQDTYKVIPFTNGNAALTQRCMLSSGFAGFRSSDDVTFPFLFCTINSKDFHSSKDRFCTGATQRSLTNEGIGRIQIVVPPRELVEKFGEAIHSKIDLILTLQCQNKMLRRTRDLLLPKLLSSELDVSEFDIDVPAEVA